MPTTPHPSPHPDHPPRWPPPGPARADRRRRPQSAFSQFAFAVSAQDREDLRWYLEDYLQYPIDPAPEIAEQVEQRMRDLGGELYGKVFGSTAAARLWARLEAQLPTTRVEVASEVDADVVLPWELLHDPYSNTDLAVHASAFVRVQRQTARPASLPKVGEGGRSGCCW